MYCMVHTVMQKPRIQYINRWYPVVLFPQQTLENARGPRDHPSYIPGQCLEYLPLHCKWMKNGLKNG